MIIIQQDSIMLINSRKCTQSMLSMIYWITMTKRSMHEIYSRSAITIKSNQLYSPLLLLSSLIHKNSYSFVKLPNTSKYYSNPLPTSIDAALVLAQKQSNLNQKCYLIQHIVQLIQRDLKLKSYKVDAFLKKQLKKWKQDNIDSTIPRQSTGRFQRIMTIAWIIKKMGYQDKQLRALYNEIMDRVQADQWYVNLDQTVKAVQAFSNYPDKQRRDRLFDKIQRNLNITLTDMPMTSYQQIALSLVQADRARSPIWQKLQKFVIKNLGTQYSPRTFFDIFKCFAITKNGSNIFYQICQQLIYKGHSQNRTALLHSNLSQFDSTGDTFSLIIQTYALVLKHSPFPLQPDFLQYLYKAMLSSHTQYKDISSLTKIINNMEKLDFHRQEVDTIVEDVIKNKEFSHYSSLSDIQELYFALQSRCHTVPNTIKNNVEKLITKDLDRNIMALPKAIQIVQFVLMYRNKEGISKNNNNDEQVNQLVNSLNKTIQRKFKYLSSEQKKQVMQCLKSNPEIENRVKPEILLLPRHQPLENQTNLN